ncbi:MAG TPA: hypothetical protein PK488_04355, partial [Bacillota bacterium]|nr:hypothetical protein [Bacillota bacterium]
MRRTLLWAMISFMLLAVPASAANLRFSGTFAGGYSYTNGIGQDKIELTLNLNLDEAGLLTAYAPLTLTSGIGIADGWWVIFTTEPLNLMFSSVSKWTSIEKTFGMLTTGITTNRYSKMWGKIAPNLSYIAQALILDDSATPIDKYMIEAELTYDLPKVVKVVSDFGWTYNGLGDTGYNMGLSMAVTFPINTKGGNMKLASSNGTIKVAIDKDKSVPMQVQASSRHGSVRMESMEGFDTITEPLSQSMHKTGLWRSRAYQGAEERADIEMETRNGSVIITEG